MRIDQEVNQDVAAAAKRALVREDTEEEMYHLKSRCVVANMEIKSAEAQRNLIREHALAEVAKHDLAARIAKEKKHAEWLQTIFPALHAAKMQKAVRAMDSTAVSHHRSVMTGMQKNGIDINWASIPDLWDPDYSLLHHYGMLPDTQSRFDERSRRICRISPHLEMFIENINCYRMGLDPLKRDPIVALKKLFKECFVCEEMLSKSGCSLTGLLLTSKLVIDLAFMRAVVAFSSWLGCSSMPAGYLNICDWPPHEGDAGL